MEPFNLDAFDSKEHLLAHLAQMSPSDRSMATIQLQMDALEEVCAPPARISVQHQVEVDRLRKKYQSTL
jgi:hypothetical protein